MSKIKDPVKQKGRSRLPTRLENKTKLLRKTKIAPSKSLSSRFPKLFLSMNSFAQEHDHTKIMINRCFLRKEFVIWIFNSLNWVVRKWGTGYICSDIEENVNIWMMVRDLQWRSPESLEEEGSEETGGREGHYWHWQYYLTVAFKSNLSDNSNSWPELWRTASLYVLACLGQSQFAPFFSVCVRVC